MVLSYADWCHQTCKFAPLLAGHAVFICFTWIEQRWIINQTSGFCVFTAFLSEEIQIVAALLLCWQSFTSTTSCVNCSFLSKTLTLDLGLAGCHAMNITYILSFTICYKLFLFHLCQVVWENHSSLKLLWNSYLWNKSSSLINIVANLIRCWKTRL